MEPLWFGITTPSIRHQILGAIVHVTPPPDSSHFSSNTNKKLSEQTILDSCCLFTICCPLYIIVWSSGRRHHRRCIGHSTQGERLDRRWASARLSLPRIFRNRQNRTGQADRQLPSQGQQKGLHSPRHEWISGTNLYLVDVKTNFKVA